MSFVISSTGIHVRPVVLTACLLICANARGQCEFQKMYANDAEPDDGFALSVAISGDVAIVGAYSDSDAGVQVGSAYIFRFNPIKDHWEQEAKLIPVDGQPIDLFGSRVAIEGDVAVVTSLWDDDLGSQSGSVYIYRRSQDGNWKFDAKLLPSDGDSNDYFGDSIDIEGSVVVVGSGYSSMNQKAYVFRYDAAQDAWLEEQRLHELRPGVGQSYGFKTALNDGVILVSEPYAAVDGFDQIGIVHVYRYDSKTLSWQVEGKLQPPDPRLTRLFGASIDVFGDVAVVGHYYGKPFPDCGGMAAAVYRFDAARKTWTHEQNLSTGSTFCTVWATDWLNVEVDRVVFGDAQLVSEDGRNGAVVLFERNAASGEWIEQKRFFRADAGAEPSAFGRWTGISGSWIIAGNRLDDTYGPNSGAVYFFRADAPDCNGNEVCDSVDIGNDISDDNNSNGIPDECEVCGTNGDNVVNVDDLLVVINSWGNCATPCPPACAADIAPIGGNCIVNVDDLLEVINSWGECE